MPYRSHSRFAALGFALAALGAAAPAAPAVTAPASAPAAAQSCTLEYQRADNMWAGQGKPNLPAETITLEVTQKRALVTDWRYEKQLNDGTTYYGSHLRVATNRGDRPVKLLVRQPGQDSWYILSPGQRLTFRHDLVEVACPA